MPEVPESIVDSSTESAFEKLTFSGEDCPRVSCKCNASEGGKTKSGRRCIAPKFSRTDGWHHRKITNHAVKSQPFTFRRSKLTFIQSTCLSSGRPVIRSSVLKLSGDAVKSGSSPNLIPLTPPVTPLRSPGSIPCTRKPLRDIPKSLLPVLSVTDSISSTRLPSVKCTSLGLSDYCSGKEDFKSLAATVSPSMPSPISTIPPPSSPTRRGGVVAETVFIDPNYKVFRLKGKKVKKRTNLIGQRKSISDDESSELSKVSDALESTQIGTSQPASVVALTSSQSSTTCSQQARMSPSAPLSDITINELAGYFETFVHIPKKMSQMAEMMYT